MAISVGFLDRFFKRPEEKGPQASITMDLAEIERWADTVQEEARGGIAGELKGEADAILRYVEEAIEVIEEIRDFVPPPEMKKRMFKPVKTAKPKYVKGMMDGLSGIRPLKTESYDAVLDFNSQVKKALKIIHTSQMNQGRIMAMFFQEEIPRLGTALNGIIDRQRAIEEGIVEAGKEGERAAVIKERLLELGRVQENHKKQKKESQEKRSEINEREDKLAVCEEELKGLKASPEYKEFQNIKNEIADIAGKIAAVESKGRNLLGPIIRVLRKYAREARDRETKKTTELFIKNPQEALFGTDDGAPAITKILKEVLGMAKRGELSIDDKRREKVENALANIESVKKEHTVLSRQLREKELQLKSSAAKEKEEKLKAKLNSVREECEKLNVELETTKASAGERGANIKKLKKELEEALTEEMGRDVSIEI